MDFDGFAGAIQKNGWNIFGAQVRRDGRLLAAYGDATEGRYPIYSATKAVTAVAVGCAADDGRLELSAPVLRYLPEEYVRGMSPEQRELYGRYITVERLLTMSVAGYPFRPFTAERDGDWLRFALEVPLPEAAERRFDYSNIPAYLAGVAASCAVGRDPYEYLTERLFSPLGIDAPPYKRCPAGYFYGASGMELTVDELSRVGQMFLDGGVYGGRRILSESYVRAAASPQIMNREGGYGYFLFMYRDGFRISGKNLQRCFVLPRKGLTVTMLSDIEDRETCAAVCSCMETYILDI